MELTCTRSLIAEEHGCEYEQNDAMHECASDVVKYIFHYGLPLTQAPRLQ